MYRLMSASISRHVVGLRFFTAIGAATAAAHIGNNFTTYLLGGLIDRYAFNSMQMGVWSMAETLSYAAAMFLIAPRVVSLSPRRLLLASGVLVASAQLWSAYLISFTPLLAGRLATGVGFGLANTALNLAAGRTTSPARALASGIALQTLLYSLINVLLPMFGARHGVEGMFLALAALSITLVLPAVWLPAEPLRTAAVLGESTFKVGSDGSRVLIAMALFTFGSLAIWPFMERAAHVIGLSAVTFGRYQSLATLASMLGSLGLAMTSPQLPRTWALTGAIILCGISCAALTWVSTGGKFALALVVFNASWFVSYPLLMALAYEVDDRGRLAVTCSAIWLLMMSLGALTTGVVAQTLGGYRHIGTMGLVFCLAATAAAFPLTRRFDKLRAAVPACRTESTAAL